MDIHLRALRRTQLWQVAGKFRLLIFALSLTLAGQAILTLLLPWPMKYIIDHVIRNVPSAGEITNSTMGLFHFVTSSVKALLHNDMFDFLYLGIGMYMLIILINSVMMYFQNIFLSRLGQLATLEIRSRLFTHIIGLPQRFFDKSQSGDLTNRISKDTAELHDIISSVIVIMVRSLPTMIGILAVTFWLDWIYALSFIFVLPVAYWASTHFSRKAKIAMRIQRRIEGSLASTAQEAIYFHKAVSSLSLENEIAEDMLSDGRESANMGIRVGRYEGMLTSFVEFIVSLSAAVVIFIGTLRIMHGCLTVGTMMVFMSYLNSLFKPIRESSKFMGKIAKSMASSERIEEIMALSSADMDAGNNPNAQIAPAFKGKIRFDHVDFAYQPDHPVLRGIDLTISPGEKIAVVGESGSGKSTLLNLLMRFYDPHAGTISIDGMDIAGLVVHSLRTQFAVVLQESYIFDATVRENIALAKYGAGDGEVLAAARAGQAHEFIMNLPNGYHEHLGEGGAKLSGGQKRRLAIARAILRDSPIVLLDEPTTGLDPSTELLVFEGMANLMRNRTTIIVTHQLSTVVNADRIVVMENGQIMDQGKHAELLERSDLYCRMWEDQTAGGSAESSQILPPIIPNT